MRPTGKAVLTAKWASVCHETGKAIPKGELMVYDYDTKKCYSRGSKTQIEFVQSQQRDQGGDMLDAANAQASDNWYSQTYDK